MFLLKKTFFCKNWPIILVFCQKKNFLTPASALFRLWERIQKDCKKAFVMELVDILVLGTSALVRVGSNPTEGILLKQLNIVQKHFIFVIF